MRCNKLLAEASECIQETGSLCASASLALLQVSQLRAGHRRAAPREVVLSLSWAFNALQAPGPPKSVRTPRPATNQPPRSFAKLPLTGDSLTHRATRASKHHVQGERAARVSPETDFITESSRLKQGFTVYTREGDGGYNSGGIVWVYREAIVWAALSQKLRGVCNFGETTWRQFTLLQKKFSCFWGKKSREATLVIFFFSCEDKLMAGKIIQRNLLLQRLHLLYIIYECEVSWVYKGYLNWWLLIYLKSWILNKKGAKLVLVWGSVALNLQ